jgi:crotonobetaine/carnitine-CoA ligase
VRRGYPGYEVRVVDEHDYDVGPGEIGELVVRTAEPWTMNAGYLGMPDRTADAWTNGWFHTGDAFTYDRDGNMFFVDRARDCIRRRGENISSFEVEAEVNAHPLVAESAAIGVPAELGEEEIKVLVVAKPGAALSPVELTEFLIPRVPRFMVPRYIEFVPELPKTEATMRVKKYLLRDGALNPATWDREAAGIELLKDGRLARTGGPR